MFVKFLGRVGQATRTYLLPEKRDTQLITYIHFYFRNNLDGTK